MANIINLNTAQPEELTTLPGIGPAMAGRIVADRPYETIDDLRVVSGVGPALIERLTPLVTLTEQESQDDVIYLDAEAEILPLELETDPDMIEPALEDMEPDSIDDEPLLSAENEDIIPGGTLEDLQPLSGAEDEYTEDIPSDDTAFEDSPSEDIIPKEKAIIPVKEKEKKPQTKKPKPVTWGRALLAMTAFSLISFLLAVLLTLGIIGTMNNGLRYVSPTELQKLNSQANSLDSQIGILLDDIESIRTRLDNLEGIPAQIGELETNAEQLNADMAITVEIVEGMNTQIEELQKSTSGFQTFLDGLAELVSSLGNQTIEVTPQEAP